MAETEITGFKITALFELSIYIMLGILLANLFTLIGEYIMGK